MKSGVWFYFHPGINITTERANDGIKLTLMLETPNLLEHSQCFQLQFFQFFIMIFKNHVCYNVNILKYRKRRRHFGPIPSMYC